MVERLKQNEY